MSVLYDANYRLLTALAEELKLPLLQIARESELQELVGLQLRSEMALRLLDGYVLGLQTENQTVLELEPVTLSSVLQDVAHELSKVAQQQGYVVQVDVGGRYGPIMGNRRTMHHAFTLLGYELMQIPEEEIRPVITFASHQSKGNIIAGVFTNNASITTDAFRRARALVGTARQLMPSSISNNGAGIFIADSLLQGMAGSFKVAQHHKQTGLAATFIPSQQLQLV